MKTGIIKAMILCTLVGESLFGANVFYNPQYQEEGPYVDPFFFGPPPDPFFEPQPYYGGYYGPYGPYNPYYGYGNPYYYGYGNGYRGTYSYRDYSRYNDYRRSEREMGPRSGYDNHERGEPHGEQKH